MQFGIHPPRRERARLLLAPWRSGCPLLAARPRTRRANLSHERLFVNSSLKNPLTHMAHSFISLGPLRRHPKQAHSDCCAGSFSFCAPRAPSCTRTHTLAAGNNKIKRIRRHKIKLSVRAACAEARDGENGTHTSRDNRVCVQDRVGEARSEARRSAAASLDSFAARGPLTWRTRWKTGKLVSPPRRPSPRVLQQCAPLAFELVSVLSIKSS